MERPKLRTANRLRADPLTLWVSIKSLTLGLLGTANRRSVVLMFLDFCSNNWLK